MNIGNRGFLATAVCILSALLIALNAAPGLLQAQEAPPQSPPWPAATGGREEAALWPAVAGGRSSPSPVSRGRVGEGADCPPSTSSARAASSAPSNAAATFDRVFRVSDADTWGDAVFPTAEGYTVLGDHSIPGSFTANLTQFDSGGRPIRSLDPSIKPGWPKSGRASSDGGLLLAITQEMDPRTRDEGRLLKVGSDLAVEWAKGVSSDGPVSVSGLMETLDGGYITLVRDNRRLGILKLDASGGVEWKKTIGTAVNVETVTVYSVVENAYLDGAGKKQCGGYVLYGGVERPASDWEVYLAALSCDGGSLLWQRIVGGPSWEASSWEGGLFFDYTTNLVVVNDRNGTNTQDADLLLAATTNSYGTGHALMLVPLTIGGGTTLSTPPVIGPVQILDGPDDERAIGPYGGPNLIRLSDGNLLLGGSIVDDSGSDRALLVKLEPDLDIVWQHTYGHGAIVGLDEGPQGILATGGGPPGMFLRLAADGTEEGPCLARTTPQLALSSVSPDIDDRAYTLQDGAFQVADVTVTMTEVTVGLLCPRFHHLPIVLRNVQ